MRPVAQQYPAPALYVVATPIGNLADLSFRALHVLATVDAIACEDTRHSARLLEHFGLTQAAARRCTSTTSARLPRPCSPGSVAANGSPTSATPAPPP